MNLLTLICVCVWSIILANGIEVDGVASFDVHWQIKENGERLGETCPNNRTRCNDRQTCCITKHGSYHCCRYSNAVCCPDKFHCCPHGSTCDSRTKRCRRREEQYDFNPVKIEEPMEWPVVEENTKTDITNQVCPNNRTKCQDSQTCCITKHGSYHCCKFENAVCCSDKFHCCPQDSTCDLKRHRCEKSMNPMLKLIPSQVVITSDERERSVKRDHEMKLEGNQTCPNNKTKCKDTKTCCITKHGNYYCCPHKNAVCCSDKYQCCPENTTCDLKNKKCIKSSFSLDDDNSGKENIQSKQLTPAENHNSFLPWVNLGKYCPDERSKCPGKKRCCVMDGGKFGCCRFNKGVCCPDLKTCCPHETTCDVKNGACTAENANLVPITKELEPIKITRKSLISYLSKVGLDNVCPDNSKCLSGERCCSIGNHAYGCCPHNSGSCCQDMKTCCPHGTQCIGNSCA